METVYLLQTTEEKLAEFLEDSYQAKLLSTYMGTLPDYAGDLFICKEIVKALVTVLEDKL